MTFLIYPKSMKAGIIYASLNALRIFLFHNTRKSEEKLVFEAVYGSRDSSTPIYEFCAGKFAHLEYWS